MKGGVEDTIKKCLQCGKIDNKTALFVLNVNVTKIKLTRLGEQERTLEGGQK